MLRTILLIGLGGGVGSIMRYLTALLLANVVGKTPHLATAITNIAGCFIAGLILGFMGRCEAPRPELRALLIIGFCGGYTTFSAFSVENVNLFMAGSHMQALLNILASILLGLLGVWLGYIISR